MPIPMSFGMSKISLLRGDEEGHYGQRDSRQKRAKPGGMTFTFSGSDSPVALLQPPSFNVLYVSTPRIGLLQTPEFQAVAQLWEETVELLKPLLRFGFPETSLHTKCPYYNENLYATNSGIVLASDRQRTVIRSIARGDVDFGGHSTAHHPHGGRNPDPNQQQQLHDSDVSQQQPPPVGPFGISTLAFLATQVMGGHKQQQQHQQQQGQQQQQQHQQHTTSEVSSVIEQHPEKSIPRSRFLVPDIPSGTLVLALNLGAYWAITHQARRSSMGGSMA